MTKGQSSSRQFHFHFYLTVFVFVAATVQCTTTDQCNQDNANGYCTREAEGDDINPNYLRLYNGGIEGFPKLYDILNFPKYNEETFFNIVIKIGKDFRTFGIHLLKDPDGTKNDILYEANQGNPEKITTDVFKEWLVGKGCMPVTWKTLINCLRDSKLNIVADNIEHFFLKRPDPDFETSSSKPSESGTKDSKTRGKVIHDHMLRYKSELSILSDLLSKVQQSVNAIRESDLKHSETKLQEISQNIQDIIGRLDAGKVRVGIVGLTKAGKSTFLNALLGNRFLPTSIQPQTANEIVIAHDITAPEGKLFCEKTKGDEPYLMASGHEMIYQEVLKLNNIKRAETEAIACSRLILHAHLNFLTERGIEAVPLELSDTPGLGEAGVKDITADAMIAVKEMCAFLLILNSRFMKTESEADLLKKLSTFHHELFSNVKLNRVITLVNAYDVFFSEEKSATILPHELPTYVSNYLKKPEVLGKIIPPERIIPMSALWALKARRWNNPSVLMSDPSASLLYKEAMLMLRHIGHDEEANLLENEMNHDSIMTTISILEPFSKIREVEDILTEMVVNQGGLVLLESAIDDTVAVIIDRVLPVIRELVADEELGLKRDSVKSFEELDQRFKSSLTEYNTVLSKFHSQLVLATAAQLSALRIALHESLKSIVTMKLSNSLQESFQLEDENKVISQMRTVRDAIPKAALTRMQTDWFVITDSVRKAVVEGVKRGLSNFRVDLLLVFSKSGKESHDPNLADDLSGSISMRLNALSENSANLLPDSISLTLQELPADGLGSEGIRDESLSNHIAHGKKQKFKSESKKKCGGGFLGWGKSCIRYTEVTYFLQAVYSPNVDSFRASFDSVLENWMSLFDAQVSWYLEQISKTLAAETEARVSDVLENPVQIIKGNLENRQVSLKESEANVDFLDRGKVEIIELKNKLRKIVK